MKTRCFILVLVFWIFSNSAYAHEQRGELILYKEPLFEFEDARKIDCQGLYDVESGNDVSTMKGFRDYWCQGRYTLTLEGQPGRTVTLFGLFEYRKDRGFLVIRKTDNRKVWLINLDLLPENKWVTRPADDKSGGVEIYFHAAPQFSQNISSVKWGKWWEGDKPQ
ncbi:MULTISPECIES: hypothetical protein [unclassified Nitrospina]|uniref:hypothetical protein n=1 Tax=unclassified Nitrospina TaxID=2638683 RepID=UPI003F98143F